MADETCPSGSAGAVALTEDSLQSVAGAKFGDVTLMKSFAGVPAGRTDRILSDPSLTVEDRVTL